MLDTQEEIDAFIEFQSAGGISEPETLIIGRQVNSAATSLEADFSSSVNDELDYATAGVQDLVDAIGVLNGELSSAISNSSDWNTYLEETAHPEGLEIPAQGHDVICKVNGVDNDSPAPFIVPITDKDEINALLTSVNALSIVSSDVVSLMSEINTLLDVEIPLPLPEDLVEEALEMASTLQSYHGDVQDNSTVIGNMNASASQNKTESIDAFYNAIDFTIANTQLSNPAIQDAVEEIYP